MSHTLADAWISQLEDDLFEIRDRLIRFKQMQDTLPNGGRSEHAAAAYIENYRPELARMSHSIAMLDAGAQNTRNLPAQSRISTLTAVTREIGALELELLQVPPQDWDCLHENNPFAALCEKLQGTQVKREYELRSFESQVSDEPVPLPTDLESYKLIWDASAHVFTLLFILAKVMQSRRR
jgi:hypothetical protein